MGVLRLSLLPTFEAKMSDEANGLTPQLRPIEIDVTDEHAFRAGVVKHLQMISDQTAPIGVIKQKLYEHDKIFTAVDLPDMKVKVEQHDKIVTFGKWLGVPIIAGVSYLAKTGFAKLAFFIAKMAH
jgi:hypothetical protein